LNLEEAVKETLMFPLTRVKFLKLAVAGALVVALSAANIHAIAQEMVQRLGPVGPNDGILATIGTMHVVAFFQPTSGRCAVTAVLWDDMGADAGVSAKGIRVNVEAGEILIIETALQESLKLQCASDGATLAAIDTESLAASGIIAQPSTQPVKQDD
jgi:hypothetical protein